MMFFKSTVAISALLMLASAMTLERNVPAQGEVVILVDSGSSFKASSFSVSGNACDKESEVDCKEFCGTSEQTGTCTADGNKITCSCKGGKAPDSNCEERCLLCMPDKSALKEASRLFKLGGSRIDEL